MDSLGAILWFAIFMTPVVTIALAWQLKKVEKVDRILIRLISAMVISFLLYHASLAIIFRNGMGP